ncbi:hypothetical protein P7C73_g5815, partial [Tremellales sp. Uapishka_1]
MTMWSARTKVMMTHRRIDQLRQLVVATLIALICFVFVVLDPVNRLTDPYAFLLYTCMLLFFFPRATVASRIEAAALGIAASTIGLAWSTAVLAIAAAVAKVHGPDSNAGRAVCGIGLALLTLLSGFVRSKIPALTIASRAILFLPIFVLTSNQTITSLSAHHFYSPFLVTILAAFSSLIPSVCLLPYSTLPRLGSTVLSTLDTTCLLLPESLASVLDIARPAASHDALARQLKLTISTLQPIYSAYTAEISYSRMRPRDLEPLVKALTRLQRNALLGPTSHVPGERIRSAMQRSRLPATRPATPRRHRSRSRIPNADPSPSMLERALSLSPTARRRKSSLVGESHSPRPSARSSLLDSSNHISEAVVSALRSVSLVLAEAFEWESPPQSAQTASLQDSKSRLESDIGDLQKQLAALVDGSSCNASSPTTAADLLHDKDRFRIALYMTSLLDLANDVLHIVHLTTGVSSKATGKAQWYLPYKVWSRRADSSDQGHGAEGHDPWSSADQEVNSEMGDNPNTDLAREDLDFSSAAKAETMHEIKGTTLSRRLERAWRRIWDQQSVVRGRISLSKMLHELKHSRHSHFALKLTIGVSLLSLPAFLPPSAAGRQWFDNARGGWGVVSFMYVLEVTTGATMRIGVYRMAGTLIGAVAGFVCTLIGRNNPYALVVLAVTCSVPISYGILFSARQPLAIVAGITLAPIMFLAYLGEASGKSAFTLAWYRFVEIIIGIAAAVLVGIWIWPIHARVRYFRAVSDVLDLCTDFYLHMSRDNMRSSLVYRVDNKQYARMEAQIRKNIQLSRTLVSIQKREISLLPRPIKLYSEVIDAAERLTETLAEIRTLRFSVPRKATVLDVLPIRREVVSAVLISIWASAHAFRSKSPLPQFIPSPRRPVHELMNGLDDHARHVREAEKKEGKSYQAEVEILYGMAENEALGEVCDILDELVAAARKLFGSQMFMSEVEMENVRSIE